MNPKLRNILIVVLIILCAWLPFYIIQYSDINREQEGCERLNTTREQLYTTIDISARLTKENPTIEDAFRKLQKRLIESTKRYATEKGSITVDCDRAYPPPFPFNKFD